MSLNQPQLNWSCQGPVDYVSDLRARFWFLFLVRIWKKLPPAKFNN